MLICIYTFESVLIFQQKQSILLGLDLGKELDFDFDSHFCIVGYSYHFKLELVRPGLI